MTLENINMYREESETLDLSVLDIRIQEEFIFTLARKIRRTTIRRRKLGAATIRRIVNSARRQLGATSIQHGDNSAQRQFGASSIQRGEIRRNVDSARRQFGAMPLNYVISERGSKQLVHDQYIFRKERIINQKTIWKCVEAYKLLESRPTRCKGRCHTLNEEVILHIDNHNHVIDGIKVLKTECLNNIKKRAIEVTDTPQKIISIAIAEGSPSLHAALPPITSIKRTIQRARSLMSSPLPTPTNIYDLDLPDIYRKTCSGLPFLQYDSKHLLPELPRILIFATAQNLRLMAESSHWYADGTFKTTPLIFYQLWTLHVLYNKTVIPTIFALLPNKTQITYIRVFG
ncbi:uncharacterized protein LOC135925884 isoform X2 [Gordionus sp. m RMFG-2023]|uniref:uncharacterized protein LOC135925884 isoform X2 n=1 Tax=Gordionus sp. m RMFG-2023 TaxID=3053472 RepID=UPI0031FE0E3B